MGKFFVAFGGITGVVGLFLPLVDVLERLGLTVRAYSMTLWAGSGPSEFRSDALALALLCGFTLLALLGIWAFAAGLSRAKAAVSLVTALPCLATAAYFVSRILGLAGSGSTIGAGLVLLTVGGVLGVVGGIAGIARPEGEPTEGLARRTAP